MPSAFLKGFLQVCYSGPAAMRAFGTPPTFLIPAAAGSIVPLAKQCRQRQRPTPRRHSSVNSPNVPRSKAAKAAKALEGILLPQDHGLQNLLLSRQQGDVEAWITLLDRHLPQPLRMTHQPSPSGRETDDPLSIEFVPSVLANARRSAKVDLLSYIGVYQERWEAVVWLIETMLQECLPYPVVERQSKRLPNILWDTHRQSLEEITRVNITVARVQPKRGPPDRFLGGGLLGGGDMGIFKTRQILGQLWQGLGCMILQAEDRSASNPKRGVIMARVIQILAHMHHANALPKSIYNYGTAKDKSVLQRPPTLHLLSGRIMTVLSDSAWKVHWAGEMEMAKSAGYELPLPRIQPHIYPVGCEIWLDLVLWACVEGGWITEAAWLVAEIERRRPNPELRWTTISWTEMCNSKIPQTKWAAGLKRHIDRARLNQATGISIASTSTCNANAEMGTRTISSEVVLAIMDGLVNMASADNHLYGITVAQVHEQLLKCKSLLGHGRGDVEPSNLNVIILRIMESSAIDTRLQPGYLQRILAMVPRTAPSRISPRYPRSLISGNTLDFSAAIIGLLYRSLDGCARQANLIGSLQALKHLQDIIDANRDTYIREFADQLRERLLRGNKNIDNFEPQERRATPMLHPEIPPYVVEAFLDLIIESKAFDLGNWLLFNDDIDGGIITPNLFSEALLQPVLLRFARAIANDHLLMRVLDNLEVPLSHPILHSLLSCQVALNRWEAVERILKHFRDTDGMVWTSTDAMYIAAAVLALECKGVETHAVQLLQAKAILQDLVKGEFNSPRNKSQIPDLQEARRANQLGRIFQGMTGLLSKIDLGARGYLGRASYSTIIPSDAFKILLDSVVENRGPLDGIELWEQWCVDPNQSSPSEQAVILSADGTGERVVQPTTSMLRSVLRPVIQDLKDSIQSIIATSKAESIHTSDEGKWSESESPTAPKHTAIDLRESLATSKDSLSAFDWGMKMYKKFGFSNGEILAEIPPPLRRLNKRE